VDRNCVTTSLRNRLFGRAGHAGTNRSIYFTSRIRYASEGWTANNSTDSSFHYRHLLLTPIPVLNFGRRTAKNTQKSAHFQALSNVFVRRAQDFCSKYLCSQTYFPQESHSAPQFVGFYRDKIASFVGHLTHAHHVSCPLSPVPCSLVPRP